jgi:hypothetical protein
MLIMFGRLVSTAHIVRLRNRWNVSLDDRPVAAFSIAANVPSHVSNLQNLCNPFGSTAVILCFQVV